MTLSIIIINYNVKYFLEQCLCSVRKAIEKMDAEVIVIDNNSTDGSADYLQPRFPWAKFIINPQNEGFSKANNIALLLAKGKYILFLNPDTIVAEDSLEKSISFMESTAKAGALGVRMIDGSGKYLKESKRGFPSPWVAFCKLSGLTSLFSHSKIFSGYYLGHLSEKQIQIIDVISGAFFFAKKEALDKTGGFDEQFFMYAEDIDLSYRIQQSGYINYYLAETTIIHFKGESSKKDFQYVTRFYKAMSLFAAKHFSSGSSLILAILIEPAIWFHRAAAVVINFFTKKEVNNNGHKKKIFLFGDKESCQNLEPLFNPDNVIITKKEMGSDDIIFCEGEGLSFKKVITYMEKRFIKCNYKIHARNSNSVVGSTSKNVSGESFGLYP